MNLRWLTVPRSFYILFEERYLTQEELGHLQDTILGPITF